MRNRKDEPKHISFFVLPNRFQWYNDSKQEANMKYITGQFALNIPCALETCGDWHRDSLNWSRAKLYDSTRSAFADYGIEKEKTIPHRQGTYNVANHIRAVLDLIEQGNFALAQGMHDDYICNDKYTSEVFHKILLLSKRKNWNDINDFMGREYKMRWLEYLRGING
jgi:hypothetical protein